MVLVTTVVESVHYLRVVPRRTHLDVDPDAQLPAVGETVTASNGENP
jgi:hypothetical protein